MPYIGRRGGAAYALARIIKARSARKYYARKIRKYRVKGYVKGRRFRRYRKTY